MLIAVNSIGISYTETVKCIIISEFVAGGEFESSDGDQRAIGFN